jgi:hypothetical protein
LLAEKKWMFEQNNTFNENRMFARFIRRKANLINNNFMREISFGNNLVCVFPLKKLNQDNVQEKRHQTKREKKIQKLFQKLNNQNIKNLSITSNNKKIEYFLEEI